MKYTIIILLIFFNIQARVVDIDATSSLKELDKINFFNLSDKDSSVIKTANNIFLKLAEARIPTNIKRDLLNRLRVEVLEILSNKTSIFEVDALFRKNIAIGISKFSKIDWSFVSDLNIKKNQLPYFFNIYIESKFPFISYLNSNIESSNPIVLNIKDFAISLHQFRIAYSKIIFFGKSKTKIKNSDMAHLTNTLMNNLLDNKYVILSFDDYNFDFTHKDLLAGNISLYKYYKLKFIKFDKELHIKTCKESLLSLYKKFTN